MADRKLPHIEPGDQLFVDDRENPVGAVREVVDVSPPELLVYVEGAGEFQLPLAAVASVVARKVVLQRSKLPDVFVAALGHLTDVEDYPPPGEDVETEGPVDDRVNAERSYPRPADAPLSERNTHLS